MNKKIVLTVDQIKLNSSEKLNKINSGSDAKNVLKALFGKILLIKNTVKNIGSNYGLKKAIVFVNFLNCLDIVLLNLKESRNIGLIKPPKNNGIIRKLSTLFAMQPIFIKMVV